MPRSELASLTLANVRGCVTPFSVTFEKGKKLTVVYGENASGKSTICDALELLGAGTIGSLDDIGLGKGVHKFWSPVSSTSAKPMVKLLTRTGLEYGAIATKGKVAWTPRDPKPRVSMLRRPQILKLVTAKPAQRYEALGSFIDVSAIERSETALGRLLKDVKEDADKGAARLQVSQEALENACRAAVGEDHDAVAWARSELAVDVGGLKGMKAALDLLLKAYEVLEGYLERFATARLHEEAAAAASEAATLAHQEAALTVGGAAAELLGLLQAASAHLSAHPDAAACPLCESADGVANLANRVHARIDAMKALQVAQGEVAATKEAHAGATVVRERVQDDYADARGRFLELVGEHEALLAAVPDEAPEHVNELPGWLASEGDVVSAWRAEQESVGLRMGKRAELASHLKTYDENRVLAERSTTLVPGLQRAFEIVRGSRHTFVNGVLAEVSEEVGRLYEAVHPGEGLDKIALALQDGQRASLDLSTRFGPASEVPPQAYFSESHLDTLGLCVHLAVAKRQSAATTILVLDDVLGSVDEPHVERIIELIYEQATHFRHVLITTHYRAWRDKLRWGWLKNGACHLLELGKWRDGHGPSPVGSTGEIERLRAALAEPQIDVQVICSKAGVVLEALLDFLTQLYECEVPRRKENRYTLGDLLPAIDKKLKAKLRVEVADDASPPSYTSHDLGPLFTELHAISQARNLLGAHFSQLSSELLDADGERFARRVLELAELLVDTQRGWPRNDSSGSYWRSPGDTRRLHPLKKPG
jgi:energy-coupling factor transporter ATP-binding protein EcfA2